MGDNNAQEFVVMRILATDTAALRELGIVSEIFPDVEDNWVVVQNNAKPPPGYIKPLHIRFAGSGNVAIFRGNTMPMGEINFLKNKSKTYVKCNHDRHVIIDIWMYEEAVLKIIDPLTIFGLNSSIYNNTSLTIGKDCLFAEGIRIWTADHHSIIDLESLAQINEPASILIGDRVWLAQDCFVLKGVTIGTGSIVGSRSLVSTDIPPKELWAGSPAKRVRSNVSWVASHPADPGHIVAMADALGLNPSL